MSRHGKKRQKKSASPIIITVALTLLLLTIIVIVAISKTADSGGDKAESSDSTQSAQSEESTETESVDKTETEESKDPPSTDSVTALDFPITAEDGKLEISSPFTYTGINPDCENKEGSDVATITLKNVSDAYLSEATVTLTLSDGTEANFLVTDLPAGMSVMAFSTENQTLEKGTSCIDISCEGVFAYDASLSANSVSFSITGTEIELTNISGSKLNEVVVYCHSSLSPDCFGGITYKYIINNLAPDASAVINAYECIIGMVEVVRIDVK